MIVPGPGVLLTAPALAVFLIAVIYDVLWGLYMRRVTDGRPVAAANVGSLLVALGAVDIVGYTANPWLLAPVVLGDWIGTYAVVRWDATRSRRS